MTLFLSGLWVYAMKGARGVRVSEAEVGDRGLVDDRRWMLIDPRGVFVSQREVPRLALVKATASHNGLEIELPGDGAARASRGGGRAHEALVWENRVEVEETYGGASEALTHFLERPVHVVYQPDAADRRVKAEYGVDKVSFADGFPFLLAGEASLADLSRRAGATFAMERFRPNLVFAGGEPWCEDELGSFRIGAVSFRAAKPCDRCSVVTVDPETGHVGVEPLRTLVTFRREGSRVLFGQNLIHEGQGTLRVGDELVPVSA